MSQFLRGYERYLLRNATQISNLESSLRTLTYFLPGRFQDAELVSEALFSVLNLAGVYNDYVLSRAVAQNSKGKRRPDGVEVPPRNRYLCSWWSASTAFRNLSLCLTLVQYTEVFMEMIAQKKLGQEKKWRFILAIELLKVCCRIALLQVTQQRTIVHPQHLDRHLDLVQVQGIFESDPLVSAEVNGSPVHEYAWSFTGKRTGKCYEKLAMVTRTRGTTSLTNGLGKADDVEEYLMERVVTRGAMTPGTDLIPPLRGMRLVAEYLYFLRPVIYVMMVRKYGGKAWKPWWIAFLVDLLSRMLVRTTTNWPFDVADLQKNELVRRDRQMIYYLLRNPLYETFTKERLNAMSDWLNCKPALSILGGVLKAYQPLWESLYFYMAAS